MSRKNVEYFRDRALTERQMADAATHPTAIAAHIELAERYEVLAGDRKPLTVTRLRAPARIRVAA